MNKDEEKFTKSCGNVFADIGLDNSGELEVKSTLARTIREIIKRRGLTQKEAAKLLETHQTQISRLSSGAGISSMTFDLLLHWLVKLNRNVTLTIKRTPKNTGHIRITT